MIQHLLSTCCGSHLSVNNLPLPCGGGPLPALLTLGLTVWLALDNKIYVEIICATNKKKLLGAQGVFALLDIALGPGHCASQIRAACRWGLTPTVHPCLGQSCGGPPHVTLARNVYAATKIWGCHCSKPDTTHYTLKYCALVTCSEQYTYDSCSKELTLHLRRETTKNQVNYEPWYVPRKQRLDTHLLPSQIFKYDLPCYRDMRGRFYSPMAGASLLESEFWNSSDCPLASRKHKTRRGCGFTDHAEPCGMSPAVPCFVSCLSLPSLQPDSNDTFLWFAFSIFLETDSNSLWFIVRV